MGCSGCTGFLLRFSVGFVGGGHKKPLHTFVRTLFLLIAKCVLIHLSLIHLALR